MVLVLCEQYQELNMTEGLELGFQASMKVIETLFAFARPCDQSTSRHWPPDHLSYNLYPG